MKGRKQICTSHWRVDKSIISCPGSRIGINTATHGFWSITSGPNVNMSCVPNPYYRLILYSMHSILIVRLNTKAKWSAPSFQQSTQTLAACSLNSGLSILHCVTFLVLSHYILKTCLELIYTVLWIWDMALVSPNLANLKEGLSVPLWLEEKLLPLNLHKPFKNQLITKEL